MNLPRLLLKFIAKKLLLLFLTIIIFIIIYQTSFSQAIGDYRSAGSGAWDAVAWQKYNGSTWIAAIPPTSADGVITIPNGNNVTLNVNIQVDQLTVQGFLTINSGDSLYIANGTGNDLTLIGTINGVGNIYISNGAVADLQNGTITGTGALNIASGGSVNVSTNTVTIDRIINNNGTFNWTNGSINGSGTMNNNSLFNDLTAFGGSFNPSFNNYSTFTKNSSNQNIFFGNFQNSGNINVLSGNITAGQASGSGTFGGTVSVSSGGTMQFGQNSSTTFTVNSNISGAGNVSSYSTTTTFSATCVYNISGTTTSISSGNMNFTPGMTLTNIGFIASTGGNITLPSGLTVGGYGTTMNISGGGTVTLNTGKTFNYQKIFLSGAYILGSDSLTISDSLLISTGNIQGTGAVTLKPGGICTVNNNSPTIDKNFINNGTINMTNGTISGNGTIYNNNLLNMSANATSCFMNIVNNGSIIKSSVQPSQFLNGLINNPGATLNITGGSLTVNANSGTFALAGNINVSSGTFFQLGNSSTITFNFTGNFSGAGSFVGSTTNVNFLAGSVYNITGSTTANSGTVTFNSGMTLSNLGSLGCSGGTINLQPGLIVSAIGTNLSLTSGGTINFNSGQKFQFTSVSSNGTINGSDTIVVNGSMSISGGNYTGNGPINILSGSVTDINGNGISITKTFNNSGTMNWVSSGITGSGIINNNNVFNISTSFAYSCSPLINNNATVNKGTNTQPNLGGGMNNSGTVNITSGTLNIVPTSSTFTHSGTFNIAASCILNISQNSGTTTENFNGTVTGAGSVTFNATTVNFGAGSVYNISGNTTAQSGTVNFNSSMTMTNAGTVSASGGTINFPSGLLISLIGSNLTLSFGGQINFNTGRSYTFNQIDLSGTLGGTDSIFVSSTLNWTGGTVNSTSVLTIKNGGTGNINNNGVQVNGIFINNGTLNWTQSGISGPGTLVNNNIFNVNAIAAHSITCTLLNNGTINKTTNNNNSFSGNFTNNSILNINIGGISVINGTNFGTINIAANASLSENNGIFISYNTISLPLNSSLSGNGTFIQNGLTFAVNGSVTVSNMQFDSITTISGIGAINSSTTFLNGCNVTLGSNMQFKNITLNSGSNFNLSGYKAAVNGVGTTISNSGNLVMTNSTVEYNGSSAQVISTTNITYKNLYINNPAGTTLSSGTLTVNDTLKMISGTLNLLNFTASLGSTGYLVENPGSVVKGTTGTISSTMTINAPANMNVGGLGATITSAANLGSTTVTRGFTSFTINGSGTVLRYFNISPSNNAGLNANLTYHYDNTELNGLNENLFNLYRSTNAGTNWTMIGGSRDTANNNVSYSGINAFSYWTAGINPLASSFNLKLIVDGLYNAGTNTLNKKDTVTVYLRSSTAPYTILDSSKVLIDTLTFTGTASFNSTVSGTYYLSIKYRNAFETWTKSGGESYSSGTVMSYDFTSSQSQSYGNTTILKNGNYCIVSGDLNQDGFVNGNDFTLFSQQFGQTGYLNADLNGDNNVNGNDFTSFSASFGKQGAHP